MKKMQRGNVAGGLLAVVIILLMAGGWVANIVKLAHMDFGGFSGMLVLRGFGIIVAPLGSVLGFI